MLYIEEVSAHNFKSFKNASLKLGQGFNCVVGPNGSGKSNVCDALLFALGETSLRRLRVNNAGDLINHNAKTSKDDGVRKAFVKIVFNGDKRIEVIRAIKSNKKVFYRLDGKRVTRQAVIDVLRDVHGEINETNTIAQGEINDYLKLNPNERRELIDIAAGIREFDQKKDAALKELEKVDTRINESRIMLNERLGMLSTLEKEKTEAERYLQLSASIKNLSYTLLKGRETEIQSQYEASIASYDDVLSRKKDLDGKVAELDAKMMGLTTRRGNVSSMLNSKSAELTAKNKALEEINKAIAINEAQLGSIAGNAKRLKDEMETKKSEYTKCSSKEKDNLDLIKRAKLELEEKSAKIKDDDVDDGTDVRTLSEKYNENYRSAAQLDVKVSELNQECARLDTLAASYAIEMKDITGQLETFEKQRDVILESVKAINDSAEKADNRRAEESAALKEALSTIDAEKNVLESVHSEIPNVREVLASARHSGASINVDFLKSVVQTGMHGLAKDLLSYDSKYSEAVLAAGGGRLNYVVVDNIDVASKAIEALKEKSLGRLSFIPLKNIVVGETGDLEGAEKLIDLISYESKFDKVFRYVFSNTYLVKSISEAKRIGFGRYRFVTLDGELIEPSGVITGGRVKGRVSEVSLERKLRDLEEKKVASLTRIRELEAAAETCRKRLASTETELIGYNARLKALLEREKDISVMINGFSAKAGSLKADLEKSRKELLERQTMRDDLSTEAQRLKADNEKLRIAIDRMAAGKKSARTKAEAEAIKALKQRISDLNIMIATIGKENEMLVSRAKELDSEISACEELLAGTKRDKETLEAENKKRNSERVALTGELESHDKNTAKLLAELGEIDESLRKLGFDKGKLANDLDKLNRSAIELESKKAQLQTRLGDLKAELITFSGATLLQDVSIQEIEKRLTISKNDLERMGAVNLKAPEAYEARKKDSDEASKKLSILESEKRSILEMISEIETRKLAVFMDTYKAVNENFKKLYGYIFPDTAYLQLQDMKDPFSSGLTIEVESGRKRLNAEAFSGGQKSLIMLMLLFSIQMRRPMSFYIFDEIDVALDKDNSKKLSRLIKEMSSSSQFIVVSHNDSLIAAADTAVGVVKKDDQSQIVGIQLSSGRIKEQQA